MFCVIQEVRLKRPNKYGAYKEIRVYQNQWALDGKPKSWSWEYTGERFDRPHMEAYKISLHQSYRVDGKVQKKQYSVATLGYYDVVDSCLYDCISRKLETISAETEIAFDALYNLVEEKLTPIMDRIEAEFQESEEYKTHKEHEEILEAYRATKTSFGKRYGVDAHEYDYCFDIFGNLKNKEYIEQLTRNRQREQESQRSYQGYQSSNYGGYGGYSSSYCAATSSTYSDDEKEMLKQFYRVLAKQFHPDINHDRDTTEQMKFLNKLAKEWNLK